MSFTVLRGYKTSITNLTELEPILRKTKEALFEKAKNECKSLLAHEVESIFDNVSLNKIERPQSIIEMAKLNLSTAIKEASLRQLPIQYNFNISVNILLNQDFTFLKVNSTNFIFEDVFNNIPELEEYSLTDNEILYSSDTKSKRWTKLMKEYEDFTPLGINLLTGREDYLTDISLEELMFLEPADRIETLARREMTSRLLNMYANFKEIPPIKLMEYTDQALFRLETPEVQEELVEIKRTLKAIIQPITIELIR